MHKILMGLMLPLLLAACGAERIWAPDEAVQRAAFHFESAPSITLVTVINTRSGSGAHSALIINGSQRVVFDPAGTFKTDMIPERNDVLFGMNPVALDVYLDYHARTTFRVVLQEKIVSPEVAEMALRLVMANGAVPKAYCAHSISGILAQLPGFEGFKGAFFPKKIMREFATYPGVTRQEITDNNDEDDRNDPHASAQAIAAQFQL